MRLLRTEDYKADAAKVFTAEEQEAAEAEIASDPLRWPVVPETGGVRKARARRSGKGKSGGARVIYYYVSARATIYLLMAYAKTVKEDLTAKERRLLKAWTREMRESDNG
jgi:mRNA-degrading endonuclease RelE of RelBE toxin-antitoxin system